MKSIYAPRSLIGGESAGEFGDVEKCSPLAQLVLFKLLIYSGPRYQKVFPSVETLRKRCNVKSRSSIRKALRELTDLGCVHIARTKSSTKPSMYLANDYLLMFAKWIDADKRLQKGGDIEGVPALLEAIVKSEGKKTRKKIAEMTKAVDRIDSSLGFIFSTLPIALQKWEPYLEFQGKFQDTLFYQAREPMATAFVEEQFRNHGLKIRVTQRTG